ncbi:unnamed protein product [Triticum turgidum subsp. durum]|uniref:Uncharacterized protein n=1 Tax=Triticum turgidum subsp. durum TaxID=4567 RepID=A0A9R0QFZ6_TRITD|nr:unnamed protein product [Triticum turgidum subsp. durum]
MAEHLASIFGTEKDRVNCPFYFKIGACRHGDRCSRLHNRPTTSPTIVLANMYQRPDMITPGVDAQGVAIAPEKMQEHFEDFYEDIYEELSKFGEVETLNVCDNLADHMIGNVYVQFREEEQAVAAHNALQGRFYSGRPIIVEYSPVTDFREATCRQFEENSCNRDGRDEYRGGGGYRGGGRGGGGRHDRYDDGPRRRYGGSPPRRGRSPPARENSEERRAKIEQWNREREEK